MRFPAPGFIELRGIMISGVPIFLQSKQAKNHCFAIKDISMITNSDIAGSVWIMLLQGAVFQTEEDNFKSNHPQDSTNASVALIKSIEQHFKTMWASKQKIKNSAST